MVRSGCETAVVEGSFSYAHGGTIDRMLTEAGIEPEEETLLIRREIATTGRSRLFINNSLATLGLLKSAGDTLADIHSQQDQQSLLDLFAHLEWLDRFGEHSGLLMPVRESHRKLSEIARQLDTMTMDEQERLRRVDVLQFQIGEIRAANVQPQEKEGLENEKSILANRERIFALSTEAYALLYEEEFSILSQARRLARILQELNSVDSSWTAQREGLSETLYRLDDLAYTMRDYTARMDFSPERLNQVQQRLSELEKLFRKYGNSDLSIAAYAAKCEQELQHLLGYADMSSGLSGRFAEELKAYETLAARLSEKRRACALRLEHEIKVEFAALAMEKIELTVHFHPAAPEGSGRLPGRYGPNGFDRVEFMIAPNKGEDMKPLARIASGGELSRVMLAIKSLCGGAAGKTLVFDEVDTGIGGRVAEAVGKRLRSIAAVNQVLCVTHLPQIAAFAGHHFNVSKEVVGERTETRIVPLSDSERLEELSRMLGGERITDITRRHAREMLAQAKESSKSDGGR
jgi:DNA repair protein RecN (Recombination protein N)